MDFHDLKDLTEGPPAANLLNESSREELLSIPARSGERPLESESHLGKRKAILIERCDQILKMILDHRKAYVETLEALAVANEELTQELQNELLEIKEGIPHLDKKLLKRIRVVGTLRDIFKHAQKTKVKPKLARKNDLNKIDDFMLRSDRALSFLNSKRRQKLSPQTEHVTKPSD
jgi:hypothetical protein